MGINRRVGGVAADRYLPRARRQSFDCADGHSDGLAETILGQAIKRKRDRLLVSTKVTFPMASAGPNDYGSSRFHLMRSVDASLKRLAVVDILHLHGQDYNTPVEETLSTLDQLVRAGKVRYVGCSNFSGWHLMKSLATADRYGCPRYVVHQGEQRVCRQWAQNSATARQGLFGSLPSPCRTRRVVIAALLSVAGPGCSGAPLRRRLRGPLSTCGIYVRSG
jgi:aryl-alcohol dehydrogenase-like predicted oxidoreductase